MGRPNEENLKVTKANSLRDRNSIALFPGSFKPPHAAHIHAVRYLLQKAEVAEVVIIISNRSRLIPGTDHALDADAAHTLLKTLLHYAAVPMDRIRIEVAEHRAIAHALGYFDKSSPDCSLLFCVGASDADGQDHRFERVGELSKTWGVSASIEVLPKAPIDIHATDMRRFITEGNGGQRKFFSALPAELSELHKAVIWAKCRSSTRPVCEIVRPKICETIADRYDISLNCLHGRGRQSVDPEFEFRLNSGDNYIVKYAGDTTVSGSFEEPFVPKPARRLAVENRVLRHLAEHLDAAISRPAVDFFDKQKRISVLTLPPATATTIDAELRSGVFDTGAAAESARLLSRLHQCPLPKNPFWGDLAADQGHWNMLITGLGNRGNRKLRELNRNDLTRSLPADSLQSSKSCILHLNFIPNNLWRDNGRMGIENFERAGSFGVPAYDVATFVAECVISGMQFNVAGNCLREAQIFIATYARQQPVIDDTFTVRLITYIAFCLLANPADRALQFPTGEFDRLAIAMLGWIDSKCSTSPPEVVSILLQGISTGACTIN